MVYLSGTYTIPTPGGIFQYGFGWQTNIGKAPVRKIRQQVNSKKLLLASMDMS
jgi:hypothetical protein